MKKSKASLMILFLMIAKNALGYVGQIKMSENGVPQICVKNTTQGRSISCVEWENLVSEKKLEHELTNLKTLQERLFDKDEELEKKTLELQKLTKLQKQVGDILKLKKDFEISAQKVYEDHLQALLVELLEDPRLRGSIKAIVKEELIQELKQDLKNESSGK